jgi:hypothetical protein
MCELNVSDPIVYMPSGSVWARSAIRSSVSFDVLADEAIAARGIVMLLVRVVAAGNSGDPGVLLLLEKMRGVEVPCIC